MQRLLLPVMVCMKLLVAAGTGLTAQDQIEEPRLPDTSAAATGASHQFEFTLPSGNVAERIEQGFNNLQMVFTFDFNFLKYVSRDRGVGIDFLFKVTPALSIVSDE